MGVRLGIIGLGSWEDFYSYGQSKNIDSGESTGLCQKDFRITVIHSPNFISRQRVQESNVIFFSNWKALIDSGLCDAVIITSHQAQIHEIALYAMRKGLHILCEPFRNVRASDAGKMMNLQMNTGIAMGGLFPARIKPIFLRIRKCITEEELGFLRRVNWRIPYGIFSKHFQQVLDLWLFLFDCPNKVYAVLEGGGIGQRSVCLAHSGGLVGMLDTIPSADDEKERLELDFEHGRIVVEDQSCAIIQGPSHTEALYDQTSVSEFYPLAIENFASHILYGEPLISSADDYFAQIELANTIALSCWTSEAVSFPCDWDSYNSLYKKHFK